MNNEPGVQHNLGAKSGRLRDHRHLEILYDKMLALASFTSSGFAGVAAPLSLQASSKVAMSKVAMNDATRDAAGGGDIAATLLSLQGPAVLWGPDGPLQDPMKEESDIRGYDGYGKFANACAAAGIDLTGGSYTVFVPTDLTIDNFLDTPGAQLTADILKYHIVPGVHKKDSWSSADLTTLQGGALTYRRMFRKDFLDDATPGVEPAGASKGNAFPADLACSNGLIHACNLVLQPGWTKHAQEL